MGQNTGSATFLNEPLGVLVESQDWNAQQLAIIEAIGACIVAQQGVLYARSLFQPLTLTTNGTMDVTLGGGNTRVLCDGYWCDGCAQEQFTVPAAPSSGTRLDAICIQAAPLGTNVGSVSREAMNSQQQVAPVNVNQVVSGVNYQYVQGDTSGNPPAAPAGYTRFIVIEVPANATAITNADWYFDSGYPEMNPTGPTGPNPLTSTNGDVTIPAVNSNVTVPAVDGSAYPNGGYVTVSDGTHAIYGQIVSGGGTDTLTVTVLDILLSSQGQTITSGATIGFAGPPGATGPAGAQGATGATGANGANGISPNPRGGWAIGTAYNALDVVTYSGSSYIAVTASTGVEPDTDNGTHWQLLAQAGAPGATGSPGATGPKGDTGSQGPTGNPGANGTPGQNAYTTTTGPVAIPAVGSTASVPVGNNGPFPFGAYLVISDGTQAFFGQVTAGGNPLTVKNLATIAQGSGTVASGATVTPSGAMPSVLPIGACSIASGNGGNPSIALPAYGTWYLELIYGVHQNNNVNFSVALSVSAGSVTSFATNADGTTSFNAASVLTMYATCKANGNQAVTFALAVNGASFDGSPYQPWTVRATRLT